MNCFKINILLFIIVIGVTSCYEKDFFDKTAIEAKPRYGVAIGDLEFKLNEFIFSLDTSIKQYDDSLIYVLFEQSLLSLTASEIIEIPDISIPSLPAPPISNQTFIGNSIVIPEQELSNSFGSHNDNDEYIDKIELNSATLNTNVSTANLEPARISLTYLNIIRNGNPLTEIIDLDGTDTYPNTTQLISGDVIDFTDSPNDNVFKVKLNLTIYKGTRTDLNGATLSLQISLTDIDYSTAYGYFGRKEPPQTSQNIPMDVFQFLPDNAEFFREPSLQLSFTNSFGFPMSLFFETFQFYSSKNLTSLDITGSGVPTTASNSKIIAYPDLLNIGTTVNDSLIFDNTNSNIADAFHFAADQLNFKPNIYLNKSGYTDENYVTENSKLDLSYKMEMPLAAKIQEFTYGDTIPFSFTDLAENIDEIDEIVFKLVAKNGFPTDAKLAVNLLNPNYGIVTNLIQDDLLTSGTVENNKVVSPSIFKPEIKIEKNEIKNSANTAYLSFTATVQTTQGGNIFVDFYSNYKIEIHIGVIAKLNVHVRL